MRISSHSSISTLSMSGFRHMLYTPMAHCVAQGQAVGLATATTSLAVLPLTNTSDTYHFASVHLELSGSPIYCRYGIVDPARSASAPQPQAWQPQVLLVFRAIQCQHTNTARCSRAGMQASIAPVGQSRATTVHVVSVLVSVDGIVCSGTIMDDTSIEKILVHVVLL